MKGSFVTLSYGQLRPFEPGEPLDIADAQTIEKSDDRSGYAPTYYPGSDSVTNAQRVSIGVGQTLGDMNMALSPTRTARITGSASDSDGKPLSGGFINAIQRSGTMTMMSGGGAQIRPDGSFALSNVPPGEHTLQAVIPGSFGQVSESVTAQVTVAGEDIDGVRLVGIKPSTAIGRIIVDPAQANSLRTSTPRLTAIPVQPEDTFGGGRVIPVKSPGSFPTPADSQRRITP